MKSPTMTKQNADVLDYMQRNGSISTMQAFSDLGITRLSARIWDLRALGVVIDGITKTRRKDGRTIRWTEYRIGGTA